VDFDAETGSRKEESISYVFKNVQTQDGLSAASSVRLEEKTVGYWSEASDFVFDCFDCSPIKFAEGTSEPPPQKQSEEPDRGVAMTTVVGIVVGSVALVLLLAGWNARKKNMQVQEIKEHEQELQQARKSLALKVNELETELKLLQK
jgi:hypothetical protein